MKNFIAILALCLCVTAKAQIHTTSWPFGAGATYVLAASGTTSITVNNRMTYVSSITTTTANATLNVAVGSGVAAGAILHVLVTTTGTETTAFSGSIAAPTHTGVAGKTFSGTFIYNGTNFYPSGTIVQVN